MWCVVCRCGVAAPAARMGQEETSLGMQHERQPVEVYGDEPCGQRYRRLKEHEVLSATK